MCGCTVPTGTWQSCLQNKLLSAGIDRHAPPGSGDRVAILGVRRKTALHLERWGLHGPPCYERGRSGSHRPPKPCRAPGPELLAFFQFSLVVTVALAGRFPHGHSHRAESSMAMPFIPPSRDITIGGQWASVPSIWLCDQRPATSGGPHASEDKRG